MDEAIRKKSTFHSSEIAGQTVSNRIHANRHPCTHTSLLTQTHNNFYHIITVQSHTPFILPLLRVTGSKIWFPPHNSLHNAILPALNCQDNLYQSRGESPGSLNGYSSARQEKQGREVWCGVCVWRGIIDIFPRAKPWTPQQCHWAIWINARWYRKVLEMDRCGGKSE